LFHTDGQTDMTKLTVVFAKLRTGLRIRPWTKLKKKDLSFSQVLLSERYRVE
jgi:hypothetical protein